ncbi:hypothetical protein QR680_004682 [Steinernema hermaphroditum]|uniref:Uncharacterized protein n=1 Tax=Steinernema hermaphroditum TaxID=289476 RepID=A0AA39HQX7_9BILA|nr:hypothetical protein QR680_004682 [Steinernema hermaphroditum]
MSRRSPHPLEEPLLEAVRHAKEVLRHGFSIYAHADMPHQELNDHYAIQLLQTLKQAPYNIFFIVTPGSDNGTPANSSAPSNGESGTPDTSNGRPPAGSQPGDSSEPPPDGSQPPGSRLHL